MQPDAFHSVQYSTLPSPPHSIQEKSQIYLCIFVVLLAVEEGLEQLEDVKAEEPPACQKQKAVPSKHLNQALCCSFLGA